MGFKRKREGYREFRPRLSPTEYLIARLRPAIAQIGEPSRYAREGLMRSIVHDLGEVPEANFPEVLETIRAVVYEQPHKIGYLAFVIAAAPSNVSFLVLEMAHDETMKALNAGDLGRFKVFFRFLCALHPIIANTDELTSFLARLLEASSEDSRVNIELYKASLLASLYLPPELISPELQQKYVDAQLPTPEDETYDFFVGDAKPYATRHIGPLLLNAAKDLQANGWDAKILAANPLKPVPEGLPPKPGQSSNENGNAEDEDDYEPAGGLDEQTHEAHATQEAAEPNESKDAAEKEAQETAPEAGTEAETQEAGAEETDASKTEAQEEGEQSASNEKENTAEEPKEPESKEPESNEIPPAEEVKEVQHALRPLHLPDPLVCKNADLSPAFFRCYLPVDGTVPTVPSEDTIGGLLLRDVAIDNMRRMDFNRREVTRQLIALDVFFARRAFAPPGAWLDQLVAGASETPPKPTWKVEDIALEAIFSQMFDLEDTSQIPLVYYHSLLIEACVMAPQDIAPVLGRGIRFMFSHLETADVELLFRLVDWFSHHVSNFAFTWKWNEWMDALSLPEDHPQLVFIKELLGKEVRLSYPQRVRDVLPEEFQRFVPSPPDVPPFKYSDNPKAEELIESLRNTDYDRARSILNEIEDRGDRADLLVQTVCHLGNRSITHATTWITKTEDLLGEYANADDPVLAERAVNAVFEHWTDASWIGELVVGQLIKVQLLKPETVVQYVVSHENLLLSSLGWEILTSYADEANAALPSAQLTGEFADWWRTRLQKAISRIVARNAKRAELAAQTQKEEAEKVTAKAAEASQPGNDSAMEIEDSAAQAPAEETANEEDGHGDTPQPKRHKTE